MLDMEDAYHGAVRTISRHVPRVDEYGRVAPAEDKLEVRIPKGVREGQLIRLPRQGSPGMACGEPGDLYLEVHACRTLRDPQHPHARLVHART